MIRKENQAVLQNLSGRLQKLSTSIFIGYQEKFFSIIDNGTKIAYRNIDESDFSDKNTFKIKEVVVCEVEDDSAFSLQTPRRTFILKAQDEQEKIKWMKTITKRRKEIIRKRFRQKTDRKSPEITKHIQSSTEHTLPNHSLSQLNETQRSTQSQKMILSTRMSLRTDPNPEKDQTIKGDFKDLLKAVPQEYVKYNTYVTILKTKVENLFNSSFKSSTYILFSSKSLYPSKGLSEENLTNMKLPPWAEVNKMYKVVGDNEAPRLCFDLSSVIGLEEEQESPNCVKVRTDQSVIDFFGTTKEEKERLEQVLETALRNLKEVKVNGRLSKRNYDRLIWVFRSNAEEFQEEVGKLVSKYIPNNHHYEPQVVVKFIDVLIPFIQQFVSIVSNKAENCVDVILQVLKEMHEEVKVHIKLTWDTSYAQMKGEHILKFLNALAAYHSVIKDHLSDIEFMSGMKELSKIYVRESWKNFEGIILSIVQEDMKNTYFQEEDSDFLETNAVVDLFKFIYEVFDLAAPCWSHKLHLHNVQKLMLRALSVFTAELKSSIDEALITNKQMIAIANNYFSFCLTVDEFYNEKFASLEERTKESYDKLKAEYKDLSHIVLDKLAFDMRSYLRVYFEKTSFYKISIDKVQSIIKEGSENADATFLHSILTKRFYEKIFASVREGILASLQREYSAKKKQNMKKIMEQLDILKFELLEVVAAFYKGHRRIQKQLNEVFVLLNGEDHTEIFTLIKSSGEDIRKAYMNLINLREDYYIGGPLYYMINEETIERSSLAIADTVDHLLSRNSVRPSRLTVSKNQELRASISNAYDFDVRSSVEKSEDSFQEPLKLISEGFLEKCKTNKKTWEKEYFRLKNSTLFFYQNERSERCQNSIKVEDVNEVFITSEESTKFTIAYQALGRQKQLEFRCQNLELRNRWLQSLNLELKRVRNEDRVKKQKLKLAQKKKNYLIIDYEELMNGKGFFSYH